MNYTLRTKKYSHWRLDADGNQKHLSETKLEVRDGWYEIPEYFSSESTALLIMDPWIDSPDDFINGYYGKVLDERLVPLAQAAAETGHRVLIWTTQPEIISYCTKIHKNLQRLVDEGQAQLFFHSDYTTESFVHYLKEHSINTLMYTGFSSNLCMLVRPVGMVPVMQYGMRLFFVPEASAAMEKADTWENGLVHEITTLIISQSIGKLIDYKQLIAAWKHPQK